MAGQYNREMVADEFRKRVIDMDLLGKIGLDISEILPEPKRSRQNARRPR